MRPFGVVVDESGIEISLERLDAVVEGIAHSHAEELVEDGAVEAFDKAVGAGRSDASAAVLDAVDVEIKLCGLMLKRKSLIFFYSNLFMMAIRLLSKTSAGVR